MVVLEEHGCKQQLRLRQRQRVETEPKEEFMLKRWGKKRGNSTFLALFSSIGFLHFFTSSLLISIYTYMY